jgi:NADPH:quinone reductase-like Zn-dependent oxidoreductase
MNAFVCTGYGKAEDVLKLAEVPILTADKGALILGSMVGRQTFQGLWLKSTARRKNIVIGTVKVTADDMDFLRQRAEAGDLKAVIDTVYPFTEMVAAHNHVDSGRKRGNVVVVV